MVCLEDGIFPLKKYNHWKCLRKKGIVVYYFNPLRIFYLHDLIAWTAIDSYNIKKLIR